MKKKRTNIQKIKLFIKLSIVFGVTAIFIILGFFVRFEHNFENAKMKKWLTLSNEQHTSIIKHVLKNKPLNQDLLIKCISKIAELPDSNEMIIHDAVFLCNAGIQQNQQAQETQEEPKENSENQSK